MEVVGLFLSYILGFLMKVVMFSVYPSERKPGGGVPSVTKVLTQALSKFAELEIHIITLEQNNKTLNIEQDGDVTIHRLPGSQWPQILDIYIGPGKRRLVKYIIDLKPDVLHIHETYGLAIGNFPIPHVFTIHGFDHANLVADSAKHAWIRSRLWKYVERRGIASQKNIISITPYVRQMVEPLTKAKIYDIDNPVDERFFKINREPEHGRILCVGWINERKNTLGSVKAFANIAKSFSKAKLVIAGHAKEADYLNRVKQCIEQFGIENQVEILGHINHIKLEEELSKASVLLLPSRQENAPMAISEAMAAGIPVIASNRCGMPYMVEEGKTGFLIDPESTEQIANRLNALLEDTQLCQKMGQAGKETAMKRFHPRIVAEKTLAVYKEIAEIQIKPDIIPLVP